MNKWSTVLQLFSLIEVFHYFIIISSVSLLFYYVRNSINYLLNSTDTDLFILHFCLSVNILNTQSVREINLRHCYMLLICSR